MGRSNKYYNVRYEILKKKHPDYLILLKTNKNKLGLKSFGVDRLILNYIVATTHNSRRRLYNYLNNKKIPYIILDTESNLEMFEGEKYEFYLNHAVVHSIFDILLH